MTVATALLAVAMPEPPVSGTVPPAERTVTHRFLACGSRTRIIEEDGTTSWSFPERSRDGGTKLVEVSRAKKVVWTFAEPEGPGIHEVQILTTNGVRTPLPALR